MQIKHSKSRLDESLIYVYNAVNRCLFHTESIASVDEENQEVVLWAGNLEYVPRIITKEERQSFKKAAYLSDVQLDLMVSSVNNGRFVTDSQKIWDVWNMKPVTVSLKLPVRLMMANEDSFLVNAFEPNPCQYISHSVLDDPANKKKYLISDRWQIASEEEIFAFADKHRLEMCTYMEPSKWEKIVLEWKLGKGELISPVENKGE